MMSYAEASFGPFRFDRASGALLDGTTQVQLGSRARALLVALIERPGELVSKAQLYECAWPGLRVDERNLRVQISGLRKALGDHGALIRTEASLGYRFTGLLNRDACPENVAANLAHAHGTSFEAMPPLGRDAEIGDICCALRTSRLVTVLGSAGVGKTIVARAVARAMSNTYSDGTYFVDLSAAADERQVHAAVIDLLGLAGGTVGSIEHLLLAFRRKRILLVLDSCEHVAEHAAALAERILTETERASALVTSRESLRVGGEIIWRLEPLDVPPDDVKRDAAAVSAYRSVQFFLKVVLQHTSAFRMDDRNAGLVASVCRRLDGVPLAIRLAASMVDRLGLDEVNRGLDACLSLLAEERPETTPRHRSIFAAVGWSYELLSEAEKYVLRSLAAFSGAFSLDAALAVASEGEMRPDRVRSIIIALANKSLLNVSQKVAPIEYRLLSVTRAYVNQRCGIEHICDPARARYAETLL